MSGATPRSVVRLPNPLARSDQPSALSWMGIPPAAASVCTGAGRWIGGLYFEFQGDAQQLVNAGVVEPAELPAPGSRARTAYDQHGAKVCATRHRGGVFIVRRWHDWHVDRAGGAHPLDAARVLERPSLRLVVSNAS